MHLFTILLEHTAHRDSIENMVSDTLPMHTFLTSVLIPQRCHLEPNCPEYIDDNSVVLPRIQ
jgi:hypothetical protein